MWKGGGKSESPVSNLCCRGKLIGMSECLIMHFYRKIAALKIAETVRLFFFFSFRNFIYIEKDGEGCDLITDHLGG